MAGKAEGEEGGEGGDEEEDMADPVRVEINV